MTDRELDDLQRMTFAFPEIHIVRKAFRDLIAEVLRLKAEREWQPIETAPHSTWVLLSHAAWIRSAEGLRFNGVWINEDYDPQPTHWMPLPKPPEAK